MKSNIFASVIISNFCTAYSWKTDSAKKILHPSIEYVSEGDDAIHLNILCSVHDLGLSSLKIWIFRQ
jgi:hypothetical protein